jgi:cytochrome c biogenesis protein CcdA
MTARTILKYSWNKLRFYLSFLLLTFYLTVGYMFLFTDVWADLLPKGRSIVGIILILFGILRFYVAYKRYTRKMARIKLSIEIKKDATTE